MTIPPFHANPLFNAHHSPMGAYFSFTCGHPGTRGGLGLELGKPADQDIFVGYKDGDRYADVPLKVLPFFNGADKIDPAAAFQPEKPGEDRQRFSPFSTDRIQRAYGYGTDRWSAEHLEFSIYTPFTSIPDPAVATNDDLARALAPAISAEVRVNNQNGTTPKTGFFALNFHDAGLRLLELTPGLCGLAFRRHLGIAAEVIEVGPDQRCMAKIPNAAFPFIKWWPHEGLEDRSNPIHLLGTTAGIGFHVPPGKHYALRLTLACHEGAIVTTRIEARYFYNRFFPTLESVLNFAAPGFSENKKAARALDKRLLASGLSPDQQFLIAHATRSYYANTQLLEVAATKEPYWIVNEGEYRMMNTLDLAVDQVFWELDQNPWVVRNLLDNFVKHYSYVDDVKLTTESTETTEPPSSKSSVPSVVKNVAPGGISFTHDQGTHNQFSPFGQSAYELKDLTGCFSYMTQEQLCNWILIAASYVAKTYDVQWIKSRRDTILAASKSAANRLHFGAGSHATVRFHDSAMCGTGQEITTYDSLDHSLAQTNGNLYMFTKCWATGIALEALLALAGEDDAAWGPFHLSESLAEIVSGYASPDGALPAILESGHPGNGSRIFPAVETILFVDYWSRIFEPHRNSAPTQTFIEWHQIPESQGFISALRTHITTLLSDPDHRNKFPDGGIKLSSTSDNSWLSKIAIVQHVARSLFNLDENGKPCTQSSALSPQHSAHGWERADAAHVKWLTTGPGAYWCACDQIVNGIAKGSKYYPRLITTALWLKECLAGPLAGPRREKESEKETGGS